VLIDEIVPDSSALRVELGLTLHANGWPRAVSSKAVTMCNAAGYDALPNGRGLDATREDGRWVLSGKTWENGVATAAAGMTTAALSGLSPSPLSFLRDSGAGWAGADSPPFQSFWNTAFLGDSLGRFHVLGSKIEAGKAIPLYALWDGKWTATPTSVVPFHEPSSVPATPAGVSLAMALTESAEPRIAFWRQDQPAMVDTLYVADPLGSAEVALKGHTSFEDTAVMFGVTGASGADVPHVLTVRWPQGVPALPDAREPRELVIPRGPKGSGSRTCSGSTPIRERTMP
jgi:hypothetical protein